MSNALEKTVKLTKIEVRAYLGDKWESKWRIIEECGISEEEYDSLCYDAEWKVNMFTEEKLFGEHK